MNLNFSLSPLHDPRPLGLQGFATFINEKDAQCTICPVISENNNELENSFVNSIDQNLNLKIIETIEPTFDNLIPDELLYHIFLLLDKNQIYCFALSNKRIASIAQTIILKYIENDLNAYFSNEKLELTKITPFTSRFTQNKMDCLPICESLLEQANLLYGPSKEKNEAIRDAITCLYNGSYKFSLPYQNAHSKNLDKSLGTKIFKKCYELELKNYTSKESVGFNNNRCDSIFFAYLDAINNYPNYFNLDFSRDDLLTEKIVFKIIDIINNNKNSTTLILTPKVRDVYLLNKILEAANNNKNINEIIITDISRNLGDSCTKTLNWYTSNLNQDLISNSQIESMKPKGRMVQKPTITIFKGALDPLIIEAKHNDDLWKILISDVANYIKLNVLMYIGKQEVSKKMPFLINALISTEGLIQEKSKQLLKEILLMGHYKELTFNCDNKKSDFMSLLITNKRILNVHLGETLVAWFITFLEY